MSRPQALRASVAGGSSRSEPRSLGGEDTAITIAVGLVGGEDTAATTFLKWHVLALLSEAQTRSQVISSGSLSSRRATKVA